REPLDLFAQARRAIGEIPERERDRRRRVARRQDARLDATHPPTAARIALLEHHPVSEPAVGLDEGRSTRTDRELDHVRPALAKRIIDNQRDRLYAACAR